jgi:hypothetical protein
MIAVETASATSSGCVSVFNHGQVRPAIHRCYRTANSSIIQLSVMTVGLDSLVIQRPVIAIARGMDIVTMAFACAMKALLVQSVNSHNVRISVIIMASALMDLALVLMGLRVKHVSI